jgi:4-hydroxy-tetrahydrodipicolinate synthase
MLVDVARLHKAGRRDEAHDFFDAHLPHLRYKQQQGIGLAVGKYVLIRRGALASDAQRRPGAELSAKALRKRTICWRAWRAATAARVAARRLANT